MKYIIKRDGTKEIFDKVKIINAVYKSTINSKNGEDRELPKLIADKIEKIIYSQEKDVCVDDIQDNVEFFLMESNRKDVAKKYILYRENLILENQNGKWMNYKNQFGLINISIIMNLLMIG